MAEAELIDPTSKTLNVTTANADERNFVPNLFKWIFMTIIDPL